MAKDTSIQAKCNKQHVEELLESINSGIESIDFEEIPYGKFYLLYSSLDIVNTLLNEINKK